MPPSPVFGWDPRDSDKPSVSKSPPSIDPQLDTAHSPRSPARSPDEDDKPDNKRPSNPYPSSFKSDKKDYPSFDRHHFLPPPASMPHRVEPYPMSSTHRRHYDDLHRRPSPPPIAAITHSPSPSVSSLDRSSVSTPPNRRSSPHSGLHQSAYYHHHHQDSSVYQPSRLHHNMHYPPPRDSGYYLNHSSFETRRYEPSDPYHTQHTHLPMPNIPTLNPVREPFALPYPIPGGNSVSIMYTEDAATKLSDRVRRRCFNCCTTDTSTWRRSNLSPGKVLCNKCGLFERTHSRPRPEQFPHKRGPLASSALRSRSPAPLPPPNQIAPLSPPYQYSSSAPPPPPSLPSFVDTAKRSYSPPPPLHYEERRHAAESISTPVSRQPSPPPKQEVVA
ncbi:uncharacterized protein BT62DRAFT_328768 [Guyanagaster necrorhizus]|uniref:GATA-type domain-containing protein n=1 Tax=Guyanagaster necrorhizus TaxID=856835 RepID=A0A9P7VMK9_9AGAR|nr:uncharacterized protein BT62DRAFT_328768 [Guyanagaster necrorhizus MCA 3950]KAG7443387.1 hypothetical protein BT62DRAFT_328768 [Guyanagaster necrorhizus MCA 3950]